VAFFCWPRVQLTSIDTRVCNSRGILPDIVKMSRIPTFELKQLLAATRRTLGDAAVEVRLIRRELDRRDHAGRTSVKGAPR